MIDMIEKIQRRATKLVPSIRHLDYSERLRVFGLTDLTSRRSRDDLIQMFKIMNKIECVKFEKGINFSHSGQFYNLRRHSKTLCREQVKNCPPRFHFLTNRVANVWNGLPEEVVNAKTVNSFKSKLDAWMVKKKEATATAH